MEARIRPRVNPGTYRKKMAANAGPQDCRKPPQRLRAKTQAWPKTLVNKPNPNPKATKPKATTPTVNPPQKQAKKGAQQKGESSSTKQDTNKKAAGLAKPAAPGKPGSVQQVPASGSAAAPKPQTDPRPRQHPTHLLLHLLLKHRHPARHPDALQRAQHPYQHQTNKPRAEPVAARRLASLP